MRVFGVEHDLGMNSLANNNLQSCDALQRKRFPGIVPPREYFVLFSSLRQVCAGAIFIIKRTLCLDFRNRTAPSAVYSVAAHEILLVTHFDTTMQKGHNWKKQCFKAITEKPRAVRTYRPKIWVLLEFQVLCPRVSIGVYRVSETTRPPLFFSRKIRIG